MKQKSNSALRVWVPTGYREPQVFRTIMRTLAHPAFLLVVAVATVTIMIFFKAKRLMCLSTSTVSLAIASILFRRYRKEKLHVSKRLAKKCNRFHEASIWLPNRYRSLISQDTMRTEDDHTASAMLYRQIGEALITLGLYDILRTKVKLLSGNEYHLVKPVEFYIDFLLDNGIGYVMLLPSVNLIGKMDMVTEQIISRTLRELGFIHWTVERMSFDDDVLLFILTNQQVSRAYDFSGEA